MDVSNCNSTGNYGTAADTILLETTEDDDLDLNPPVGPVSNGGDNADTAQEEAAARPDARGRGFITMLRPHAPDPTWRESNLGRRHR